MSVLDSSSSVSTFISTSRRTSRRIFKRSRPVPGESMKVACSGWSVCCPVLPSTSSHAEVKTLRIRIISTRRSSNSAGSFSNSRKNSANLALHDFITCKAHRAKTALCINPSMPVAAAVSANVSEYSSRSMLAFLTIVGVNRRSIPMRIRSGRLCASSTTMIESWREIPIAESEFSRIRSSNKWL